MVDRRSTSDKWDDLTVANTTYSWYVSFWRTTVHGGM